MSALPIDDWTTALDRMTAALHESGLSLDRRQASWDYLLDASHADSQVDPKLGGLETRLLQWQERLGAAEELAGEVEAHLHDREGAIKHWLEKFAAWRDLIKQCLENQPSFTGNSAG